MALHPNGRDVFFETCCEPASGHVLRVPIDGSAEPEPFTGAYGIDISADGRWLIGVAASAGLLLYDLEARTAALLQHEGNIEWEQVGISSDGTEVAVAVVRRDLEGNVESSEIERYAITNGQLGELRGADSGDVRAVPLYTSTGRLGAADLRDGLDLNVDPSGTWLLEVDAQGRLIQRQEGTEPTVISEGPFIAADW